MKPIEIGCLAMVINPEFENFGRISKVVGTALSEFEEEIGVCVFVDHTFWKGENCPAGTQFWVLDKSNLVEKDLFSQKVDQASSDVPFLESSLMRVDGDVDEESQCDSISKVNTTVKEKVYG